LHGEIFRELVVAEGEKAIKKPTNRVLPQATQSVDFFIFSALGFEYDIA